MGSMNSVLRISPGCTEETFLDLAMVAPLANRNPDLCLKTISGRRRADYPEEIHTHRVTSNLVLAALIGPS
jgi:hypothetical protein